MEFSLIIYAAIGGGLGGGLGALIAKFLKKSGSHDAIGSAIVAIFVFAGYYGVTGMYKNMVLPRIIPMDVTELTDELPVLGIIKEQVPDKFAEMLRPLDEMVRKGDTADEEVNLFRQKLDEALFVQKSTASADSLRAEYRIASEMFSVLKDKAPIVCTQKFFGRPYQVLEDILDDDFGRREREVLAEFYTNPPRPVTYVPDLANGEQIFTDLIQSLIAELEILVIDPPIGDGATILDDHRKICELNIRLNDQIINMTDEEVLNAASYSNSIE